MPARGIFYCLLGKVIKEYVKETARRLEKDNVQLVGLSGEFGVLY
jgi:hypothetical protein